MLSGECKDKMKDRVIKMKRHTLEFSNLSTTLTVVKMASQVKEFLVPVLEEVCPDGMLFQQDGASR
jgi:hypothetical protein